MASKLKELISALDAESASINKTGAKWRMAMARSGYTSKAGQLSRCVSCVLGMYCITGVKFVLEHCPTCGKNLRLISILSDESPQQVYEFETTWDWEKKTGITIQTPEQLGRVLGGTNALPPVKKDRLVFNADEIPKECIVQYYQGYAMTFNNGIFILAEQRCPACETKKAQETLVGNGVSVLRENGGEFEVKQCKVTRQMDGNFDVELEAICRTPLPLRKIGMKFRVDSASKVYEAQQYGRMVAENFAKHVATSLALSPAIKDSLTEIIYKGK
jgi:predicted RNA-binding Zn-ribbon protein involved in translation (DUF1610 family)